MFRIRAIDHLVLRVIDLDAMLAFYCGALGCTVERRQDEIGLVQLRAGNSLIDLVPVSGELGRAGGAAPGVEAHNLDHFCLRVEPFDDVAIRRDLAAHGIQAGPVEPRYGAEGEGPSIYLSDPQGNVVELKGPPAAAARSRSPGSSAQDWRVNGLEPAAVEALAHGLPGSALSSLLMTVFEARATARRPADVMQQWQRDRFVKPSPIDQRASMTLQLQLLELAAEFEAIELSPLAPLAACTSVTGTSQQRIVSSLRSTEVVSDPSNVLALECARRLRDDASRIVRLATAQRCVRAQPVPGRPGLAAHFGIFCLGSAGLEREDHGFTVDELVVHLAFYLRAWDAMKSRGFALGGRTVRLMASADRERLADRIEQRLHEFDASVQVERSVLSSTYYAGLRFMIDAHDSASGRIPLIDGGAFDWLHPLSANRKMVFIASALGTQLALHLFEGTGSSLMPSTIPQ